MIGCIVEGEYSGLARRALVRVPSGIMAAAGNGRLRDGLSLRLFEVPRWRNLCSTPLRYSKNLGTASTNRIMLKMRKMGKGALKGKITNALKDTSELLLAFARGTRLKIGVPGIGVEFPAPDEIKTNAESFQTQIDEFSKTSADLVSEFLGSKSDWVGGKLIVFIDDLDRCLPENVTPSLEALKLFLNEAPCVFVIGEDRAVIEKAVQAHYGSAPGHMGRDYLDKIIQVPFVIPPVRRQELQQHFSPLVKEFDEPCWKIVDVASHGNPRFYSRVIASWKVINARAPQTFLNLADDPIRRMVVIAIVVSLRFPRLHELGMPFPTEFKMFYDRCQDHVWDFSVAGTPGQEAVEYHAHWEDPSTRVFSRRPEVALGDADNPMKGSSGVFERAFRLAARTGRT